MSNWTDLRPIVVAAEMGYGHLRPAMSLADALGTDVVRADVLPLAGDDEVRFWKRSRNLYELTTRLSQRAILGQPFRRILNAVTAISDLYPYRDQSRPTRSVRALAKWIDHGLGEGLVRHLNETGRPLVTTFYAPAIAADRRGAGTVYCVVTDSDIHRIWAPENPASTRINYLVPSLQALRRLRAYGIPRENIEFTGFPLPLELAAEEQLRRSLLLRIVRLDPDGVFRRQCGSELRHRVGELPEGTGRPPLLTFAVGGAGVQAEIARAFLPSVGELVERGRLRVALVAGIRREVEHQFHRWIARAGLDSLSEKQLRVVCEDDFPTYYRTFNTLLGETDILWTKPSELVFYAALGIPVVLSWPVGAQERANRRWLVQRGGGLRQLPSRYAGHWLTEWLNEGLLAAAAWSGYLRLPRHGTTNVLEVMSRGEE